MVLFFFFIFVLVSHIPLVPSARHGNTSTPTCPKTFECSDFGSFEYPFYNVTDTPCGLIKVNCDKNFRPEIQLEDNGLSYEIKSKPSPNSVVIHNETFHELVKNQNCKAFTSNFTSPRPLLFTFNIQPFIPLFKCNKTHDYTTELDAYFEPRSYLSYKRCEDHDVYYKYLISNAAIPSDLPPQCEVLTLPLQVEYDGYELLHKNNIFSLLSSQFSIIFHLSTPCHECRTKTGLCQIHNQRFECLAAAKGIKTYPKLILIPALSVGSVILSIVLFVCLIRKHGWKTWTKNQTTVETFLKNNEFIDPKRYSYSEVKKMTNSFKIKLGQGGFGSVYKGKLSNGNLVAVKILSESKGNGEEFINEVASVGKTCHVNIVTLLGFCFEGRQRALIYEFMPNGSLERFTYGQASSSPNRRLGWEKLHKIAIGIAQGLEYLHIGCNTRILHFDIKPHNILLDQDFCPKISDFGLAKLLPEKKSRISMSHIRGTPGYIAPEMFSRIFGEISHKSDIYSYGMMVLEMVGGRKNGVAEVVDTSEIYFPDWIYKKVELHEELELHEIMSDEDDEKARNMIIVGLWCIQTNPFN